MISDSGLLFGPSCIPAYELFALRIR